MRNRLKALLQVRTKTALAKCRRNFYEHGNKPSRLLARALRQVRAQSYIPHIDSPEGKRLFQHRDMANQFRNLFSALYNLPTPPGDPALRQEKNNFVYQGLWSPDPGYRNHRGVRSPPVPI